MKKRLGLLIMTLLLGVLLIPSFNSKAATAPGVPSGITLYRQEGKKFGFTWNFDANIALCSDDGASYGYEISFTTLKNKNITTMERYSSVTYADIGIDATGKVNYIVENGSLQKQGFKIKIRAISFDSAGNKLYSDYAEKVIIPRATITSKKLVNKQKSVKIKWKKVKGAKSYTVYVSKSKESGYKKKGTAKGNSFVLKNLKSYQDYYVYVVANKVKYKKKKLNSTKADLKYSNIDSFYIYTKYTY